ncbi:hypothetical protein JW766_05500 [Candidatus Dojkabacteria bacterium]|nr:hypothetical protein [Candidatus Dojkabacteria bacterium]
MPQPSNQKNSKKKRAPKSQAKKVIKKEEITNEQKMQKELKDRKRFACVLGCAVFFSISGVVFTILVNQSSFLEDFLKLDKAVVTFINTFSIFCFGMFLLAFVVTIIAGAANRAKMSVVNKELKQKGEESKKTIKQVIDSAKKEEEKTVEVKEKPVPKERMKEIFTILIFILIFIGSAGAFIWLNERNTFNKEVEASEQIQALLARAMYARLIGDSIVNGEPVPEGWDMKKIRNETGNLYLVFSDLDEPYLIEKYNSSASYWVKTIKLHARPENAWPERSSVPEDFSIFLSDKELESLFKLSIVDIAKLKEFGDTAIRNGDTETMRYIAAKLMVEEHWLRNLEVSQKVGSFGIANEVYAQEFKRNPCVSGGKVCLGGVVQSLPSIYRPALGYSVGETSAPAQWNEAWNAGPPLIDASELYLGGAGITQGEVDEHGYSPLVRKFMDECKAKGGIVGGTGGVMTRLPTTESGYSCWYDDGACWDLLTYSGGSYSGGNAGCPEVGLLPNPVPDYDIDIWDEGGYEEEPGIDVSGTTTTTVPQVKSWDGYYYVDITGVTCNVEGFSSMMSDPFSNEFQVSDNMMITPYGNFQIDSSGRCYPSFTYSASGFYMIYQDSFQFSISGGSVNVTGSTDVTVSGQGVYVSCWGNYSGYRK